MNYSMERFLSESTERLERPLLSRLNINWQFVLIAVIILAAIISRFAILGERVMSHDETIHVYHNSWSLYRGTGYQHDPLSHGPLQTHLVALSYFLFGDSDFSARIPAALFGIATVIMVWNYRRYIGRTGAIIAMILMVISPFMLYYGRYVRNDIFSAFFGVVLLWSMLRYLETGKDRYTYYLSAVYALHFAAKETSFIYAAQALVFLAFYFVYRVLKSPWSQPEKRNKFMLAFTIGLLLIAIFGGLVLVNRQSVTLSPAETAAPAIPGEESLPDAPAASSEIQLIIILLSLLSFLVSAYYLISGYSWKRIQNERSFGLLILLGTFVTPQLSPFLINYIGWNIPTNASQVKALGSADIFRIGLIFVPMMLVSVVIGLIWNRRLWLKNALVFYGIYVVLFTTVFTNGAGFFTGMVGSLGYWLEQQGVKRGSQPWFYYLFVQIPIYEYLAAAASIAAIIMAFFGIRPKVQEENQIIDQKDEDQEDNKPPDIVTTAVVLFGFWAVTSMLAYTIAGEKMPWLTVHLAWPLILCGSWAIGYLIDITDWTIIKTRVGWVSLAGIGVLIASGTVVLSSLLGTRPPFQGKTLENLQATSTFLVALIVLVISVISLIYLIRK